MQSTMMLERSASGLAGLGMPGMSAGQAAPAGMAASASMMMVPRCTIKIEKCTGGCKIICSCDDKLATSMVQNLCTMLAGGLCSCCTICNGMVTCTCNLTMGMCRCECTESGVMITCTSGDAQCCEMIQACCDCLCCMLEAGCTCCVLMNNTPVCCGMSEMPRTAGKAKNSR
jgi:hypothetical protein